MALIAFRAVSAMGSGTTSVSLTTPATAVAGDFLIAFIGDRATVSTASGTPSGWTRLGGQGAAGGRIQFFTAFVGVGGVTANQATSFTGLTTSCIGAIAAYSGVDPVNPTDGGSSRSNASGTTGTTQSSANTFSAYVVLGFISFANGSTWSAEACATNPTAGNLTERLDSANGTTNSIAISDGVRNPKNAGATGVSSATMGTAGVNGGSILVLRQAYVGQATESVTASRIDSGALSADGDTSNGVTAATTDSGVITRDIVVALTGASMSASSGTVAASGGATVFASGSAAQASAGNETFTADVNLQGGTLFTDDFNRANGGLGARWGTPFGNWQIVGNKASGNNANFLSDQLAVANAIFAANQFAEIVIGSTGHYFGPTVRWTEGHAYLGWLLPNGHDWIIGYVRGGVLASGAVGFTAQPGDVLRLEVEDQVGGQFLTFKLNGVILGTALDTLGSGFNLPSGPPGMGSYENDLTTTFDSFSAGPVIADFHGASLTATAGTPTVTGTSGSIPVEADAVGSVATFASGHVAVASDCNVAVIGSGSTFLMGNCAVNLGDTTMPSLPLSGSSEGSGSLVLGGTGAASQPLQGQGEVIIQ